MARPKQLTPEAIKRWRRRWGLTQTALAEELGVIRDTVAKWEGGVAQAPAMLARALRDLERELQKWRSTR